MKNTFIKMFGHTRYNSTSSMSAGVLLLVVLLASAGMPTVPEFMIHLFNNTIFKLCYMTFILVIFNYCPLTALLVALIFLIVLQSINKYAAKSHVNNVNIESVAKGIVNSVADTASELVNDTGSILNEIGRGIKNIHNHVIINEDKFENLTPSGYSVLKDQYSGPEYTVQYPDTIPQHNNFYDNVIPAPETQNEVSPMQSSKMETFKDTNIESFDQMSPVDKLDLTDQYSGPGYTQQYVPDTNSVNHYISDTVPQPLNQTAVYPACMISINTHYPLIFHRH